jgi:glutamate-1-semialdehyde 2,1-aminomutase
MTAGKVAMELFDRQAVEAINNITEIAKNQLREVIKDADVPVVITGAGSMFRFHFRHQVPNNHRETFQSPDEIKLIKDILDYLFYEENLIMINTFACMFATSITQKEVDILTKAIFNAFTRYKKEITHFAK